MQEIIDDPHLIDRAVRKTVADMTVMQPDETLSAFVTRIAVAASETLIGEVDTARGEVEYPERSLPALLERANMSRSDYQTRIIYSTDRTGRVKIGPSYDRAWEDTGSISFLHEGTNLWYPFQFSPARLRLIARQLVAEADRLENHPCGDPGMRCIDRNDRDIATETVPET